MFVAFVSTSLSQQVESYDSMLPLHCYRTSAH